MNSKLISFEDYKNRKFKRTPKQFFYLADIKYSLDKLYILSKKKQKKKKKKELEKILFDFYEQISKYYNNINSIIIIQKQFRKYKKDNNIYGPILYETSNNQNDFYTLVPINEIPKDYLFSYRDNNKFVYSFDIRSFDKLINSNSQNPYTRENIPNKVINLYKKRLDYIKKNNIIINQFVEEVLTPEQTYKNRVFKIFQTIDLLNTMAGGTNPKWFYDLTIMQLKAYYKVLEDIWNYRAELTPLQKYEIVKNKNMFVNRVNDIYYIYNEQHLREIILEEIEKLLFTSDNDVHRATASYYILIAFVEISPECTQAMPWLIQY